MDLYVVTADTYTDSYGAEITLFGVFDTEKQAKQRVEHMIRKNPFFKFNITKIKMNRGIEEHLGGYYE